MTDVAPNSLRVLVARLEVLAARRLSTQPRSIGAAGRARQLADRLAGHVRVRANSLDAPLLVLIQLQLVEDETIAPGVALVDAPDIDSIEHANRINCTWVTCSRGPWASMLVGLADVGPRD